MAAAELQALRHALTGVACAAVPGALAYGVFSGDDAAFANRLIVVAHDTRTGQTAGFNAMPVLRVQVGHQEVQVLHLGLLVIHPQYQRQGLQGLLYGLGGFSAYRRLGSGRIWISNVTEVPAVFGAVADNFIDVYPHYGAHAPTAQQRAIACAIMAEHRHEFGVGPEAGFDAERFVITGSYTGGSDALQKTFEAAPAYRNPAANAYCRTQLDYGRGDDFLQIGQFDSTIIENWATRRLPAGLRPQMARPMRPWSYAGGAGSHDASGTALRRTVHAQHWLRGPK